MVPSYGYLITGDGSGGGGAGGGLNGGAGGSGGGNNDTLFGSYGNDVIFGDGSGGGAGGTWNVPSAPGYGGGGADTLYGGAGNDILFGDGFNGENYSGFVGGSGGFGGGGGGGGINFAGVPHIGGTGGLGASNGAMSGAITMYASTPATKDGFGSYCGKDGISTATYGAGGGGFGAIGNGGDGALTGGGGNAGGTSVYSAYDAGSIFYNIALTEVTNGNIYNSTAGTTNGYGAGNDILDGGAGSDHYFGMGGSDTFVVSAQDNASGETDTLWDFNRGEFDLIQLENASGNLLTSAQINTLLGSASVGTDTTLTMSNGSQLVIKGVTDLTAADFLVACFLPGTLFETLDGMKAIEELQIGEMIKTADGYAPLKWLAHRHVDWSMSIPRRVAPVLVKQGALGNNLPLRDLYVSPAHAFEIDGVLINAELLVNGSTIVQLLDYDRDFTWYNIELDTHAIVYAEGAAVESYLEVGDNRNSYDNAAEFHQLYPHHVVPEAMAMGRITLKRQLPSLRKAAA